MEENTYSVFKIADWFLGKADMTPKKLQKIAYYAESWSNALRSKKLINDTEFQAWAHGPVSPELYRKYKGYGWNLITDKPKVEIEDEIVVDLLESVWVTYGEKSANELEALTHQEAPWRIARLKANASEGEACQEVISPEDMASYYNSIYIGNQ